MIGLLLLIGGFLLVVFQGIAMFMGTKAIWKSITLMDLIGQESLSWVNDISIYVLQQGVQFVLTTPIYIMCFAVGGGLLMLKSFLWRN